MVKGIGSLGAYATRPKISNVEASQKYGHNGSVMEAAKMSVKMPDRAWADLVSTDLPK